MTPKTKFNNITTIKPVTEDQRDVNDNKIKFQRKTTANVEIDGRVRHLELLITTKQTHPLLGVNWMEMLGKTLKTELPHHTVNHIKTPDQVNGRPDAGKTMLKRKFHELFTKNNTVNNVEVGIQIKEGAKLIQHKGRPIPIHLQPAIENEIQKLKKQGHIGKAKTSTKTV